MAIFDAPNRDLCEVRRQKTNTPLQALALQNDEQVLEGARVLATNVINDTSESQEAVQSIFQRIMLRNPTERELGMMVDYFERHYDKFNDDNESAEKLLAIGEYPANPSDTAKTAALMMVAQVLYNLDETITKE
jgi:hypothetical protein